MKKIMKKALFNPLGASVFLILSLASSLYFDYLNSAQTYIFNYHLLFELLIAHFILTISQSTFLFFARQKSKFWHFLFIISFYLLCLQMGEIFILELGFQYSIDFSIALYLLVFLLYFIGWLCFSKRKYWRKSILILLPIALFNSHSYFNYHDYFRSRLGSYPIYQNNLRQNIWNMNKIKSIDTLFELE